MEPRSEVRLFGKDAGVFAFAPAMTAPTYWHPTATGGPLGPCSCAYRGRFKDDPGLIAYQAGTAELPHDAACFRQCWAQAVRACAYRVLEVARLRRAPGVAAAEAAYEAAMVFIVPRDTPGSVCLERAAELELKRVALEAVLKASG